jgi:ParB family chromosome partitioning protein
MSSYLEQLKQKAQNQTNKNISQTLYSDNSDIDISTLKENPYQNRLIDENIVNDIIEYRTLRDKNELCEDEQKALKEYTKEYKKNIIFAELSDLTDSIEKNGLLQPILVHKSDDTIIAGHRRYLAHKILNKDTIKATYKEKLSKKDMYNLCIEENNQRSDITPIEFAMAIENGIYDGLYTKYEDIAISLNISIAKISKLIKTLQLPSDIKSDIIKYKTIKELNPLYELTTLSKIDDGEKKQIKLYNSLKNGDISKDEFMLQIKEYKKEYKNRQSKNSKNHIKIDKAINILKDLKESEIDYILEALQRENIL